MARRPATTMIVGIAALVSTSALPVVSASAQAPAAAWTLEQEGFEVGAPVEIQRRALGARTVRADFAMLQEVEPGDTVRLDLRAGESVVAEFRRVTSDEFNGHVLFGRIVDEPMSQVILVLEPGGLAGLVNSTRGKYQIRWVGGGLSSVHQSDPSARRGDITVTPPVLRQATSSDAPAESRAGSTLDVLHVFTKKAAGQIGGGGAVKAATAVAVAAWNDVLSNSNIDTQVRLVGNKKVNYKDSGTDTTYASKVLGDLRTGSNGFKKAARYRKRFGADIVSMAIEINQVICGLGYVNGHGSGLSAAGASFAYHVNSVDCLTGFGGLTMAHEGGHNLGMSHDAANARLPEISAQAFPYSFGYRVAGAFATVMAYPCELQGLSSCPEIPFYSDPKQKVGGKRIGQKKKADNALSLRKSHITASKWVDCEVKCGGVNS